MLINVLLTGGITILQHRNINFIIFIGFLSVGYIIVLRNASVPINNWVATHWLFSVQEGFYSRALLGTITRLIFTNYFGSLNFISVASLLFNIIFTTIIIMLCNIYYQKKQSCHSFLVALVFITSPGSIQFYALEIGRFDQIGYIFTFTALFILLLSENKLFLMFTLCFISILLVLLHEVMFILIIPTLLSAYLIRRMYAIKSCRDSIIELIQSLALLIPAAIITIVLVTKSKLDYEIFEHTVLRLQEVSNFDISNLSLLTQFRTIQENVVYTAGNILSFSRLTSLFLAFIALFPSGLVGYFVLCDSLRQMFSDTYNNEKFIKLFRVIILFCCFSPLILVFIGHDYPRWMAAIIVNIFLIGIYVLIQPSYKHKNLHRFDKESINYIMVIVVAFSLAVGPVSATSAPSSLNKLLSFLDYAFSIIF